MVVIMSFLYRSISRQRVEICQEIASGAEGRVYTTDQPGLVAKIYIASSAEKINKLKVMIKNPPEICSLQKEHIALAWPVDLLERENGDCVGFLMPEVVGGRDLLNVYNHKLRNKVLPQCNWYYLHSIAQNLAAMVHSLHTLNCVVGDLKPENILVSGTGLISIIDVDSFQIYDSTTQKIFRCGFASEEFTPPEMLGIDLREVDRTEIQDRFGLAVIIWLLLFGSHPFSGIWLGNEDDPPNIDERIKNGHWIAAPNTPLKPTPLMIPVDIVHYDIQKLFHRCFTDGFKDIQCRPSAEEWFKALKIAVGNLATCSLMNSHYYTKSNGVCYWCEVKKKYGIELFPGENTSNFLSTSPSVNSSSSFPSQESIPEIPLHSRTSSSILLTKPQRLVWKLLTVGAICSSILLYVFSNKPTVTQSPTYTDASLSNSCRKEMLKRLNSLDTQKEKLARQEIETKFDLKYPNLTLEPDNKDHFDEIIEWCEIADPIIEKYE